MNIAILSGKGGTGKTTAAVNLVRLLQANYIDCDVEEPNGFIFLNPNVTNVSKVKVDYPVVEESKCTLCGRCVDVCQFNALAMTKDSIFVFDKLCHSCHACKVVCGEWAINFSKREIGRIEEGSFNGLACKRGLLKVSEPMAVPIIRELLQDLPPGWNILDCPPGTSCNVVNTVQHADAALMVAEPNIFGMHDLKIAIEMVRLFELPFGVIINKYTEGTEMESYLENEGIKIVGYIPYSRRAAEKYAAGGFLTDIPEYRVIFNEIAEEMKEVLSWS